jgi:Sec-independent protein secretion pathway component TatC
MMPLAMRFFLSLEQGRQGAGGDRAAAQGQRIPVADHGADPGLRLVFQLPVVLTLLARIGVVNSDP